MQINTIDIRLESVDRPNGGKKANKDDASAESAFAAFFATQLDARRRPEAKTAANGETDAVDDVDSAADAKAKPKSETTAKQTTESESTTETDEAQTQVSKTPSPEESAEGEQSDTATVVVLQPKRAESSAKFSVVAKDGSAADVKLDVSSPQPAVTTNAKVGVEDAAPGITPQPVASAPVAVTPKVAPAVSAGKVQTAPVVVEAEVIVTPQPAAKSDGAKAAKDNVATEAFDTSAEVPVTTMDSTGANTGEQAGDESASSFTERAVKLPVSKLQSHAVGKEPTPDQAGEASVNAPAVKAADAQVSDSAAIAQATPQENVTESAPDLAAAQPELQKAEPQVVRNVTHVVSQDGAILATQTAEVRSESAQAPTQREVVVVEKTTVQALPEQALRGARFLLTNTEQTMRIRLLPESLGEVRLEVITSKGEVTVKLASANAAVREILQTHAPGLQHAISQDNTGNVRVTVTADVGSSAWLSSNAQRNNGQHDPNAQGQANHRSGMPSSYREANAGTTATPRREAAHAGNLNIYV